MSAILNFKAFTARSVSGKLHELITDIGISLPFIEPTVSSNDSRIYKCKALWDTGATASIVTKKPQMN